MRLSAPAHGAFAAAVAAILASSAPSAPPAPPPRPKLDYDTPFMRKTLKSFRGERVDVQLLRVSDGQPASFTGVIVAYQERDLPAGRAALLTVSCEKGARQFKLSDVRRLLFKNAPTENEFRRALQQAEGIDLAAVAQADRDIARSLEEKPAPPPSARLKIEETPKLNRHAGLIELLTEARGERTEFQVALTGDKTAVLSGTIVGVERAKIDGAEVSVVNYFSKDGLQTFNLTSIQRVKFTSPEAERMFRPTLDDIAAGTWSRLPKAPAPRPKS